MKITPSTITIKYLLKVILPNNGLITMTKEIPRPDKGKGSQAEISSVKRIYKLIDVEVAVKTLEKFACVEKGGKKENIITVSSKSKETELTITQHEGSFASVSGKATYQGLTLLGLNQFVKLKIMDGNAEKICKEMCGQSLPEWEEEFIALVFPNSLTLLYFMEETVKPMICSQTLSPISYYIPDLESDSPATLFLGRKMFDELIRPRI